MEFFQKLSILTENLVDFDVTCSVILGTVAMVVKVSITLVKLEHIYH